MSGMSVFFASLKRVKRIRSAKKDTQKSAKKLPYNLLDIGALLDDDDAAASNDRVEPERMIGSAFSRIFQTLLH